MSRIAIDLNVRVRGNQTYAGFEDVIDGDPETLSAGDYVEVFEAESGVYGKAQIAEVDGGRQLIYLLVDWLALVQPPVPVVGGGTFILRTEASSARTTMTTAPRTSSPLAHSGRDRRGYSHGVSQISDAARASVLVGDYVGVDATSKVNVIGMGANLLPLQPQSGTTAPLTVAAIVEIPSSFAPQEFALALTLMDVGTGQAVQLPNPQRGGQMDAVRIQQVARVIAPQIPGLYLPAELPSRVQAVLAFPAGLQLRPGGVYEWRLEIDGATRADWTALIYVPGPPPGPVIGGPVGPSTIPGVGPSPIS